MGRDASRSTVLDAVRDDAPVLGLDAEPDALYVGLADDATVNALLVKPHSDDITNTDGPYGCSDDGHARDVNRAGGPDTGGSGEDVGTAVGSNQEENQGA